jgi:predicted ATP-grasp superfamily ATP-dependent carboligase
VTKKQQIGAVVVGGDHPGLAIARSLGRRGVPVVVIDDQFSISKFSKDVNFTDALNLGQAEWIIS